MANSLSYVVSSFRENFYIISCSAALLTKVASTTPIQLA